MILVTKMAIMSLWKEGTRSMSHERPITIIDLKTQNGEVSVNVLNKNG